MFKIVEAKSAKEFALNKLLGQVVPPTNLEDGLQMKREIERYIVKAKRRCWMFREDSMASQILKMLTVRNGDEFVKLAHAEIARRLAKGDWRPTCVCQRINLTLRREGWNIVNLNRQGEGAVYQLQPNAVTKALRL